MTDALRNIEERKSNPFASIRDSGRCAYYSSSHSQNPPIREFAIQIGVGTAKRHIHRHPARQ
jgi:hypothetical protein